MKYRIWFEIYEKKMQTVVEANSPDDAKYKLYGKIRFVKVEEEKPELNDGLPDVLKTIFGMK
jgi:hypothetical protein